MASKIQLRRDTAANWTSANPVLASGEPGLETDTGKIKYGNGSTAWNLLPYASTGNVSSDYGNSNVATFLTTYNGNLSANLITVNSNANSTSPTTGALKVAGGIGAVGNIHSGGEIHSSGNMDCAGNTIFVGPFADATGIVDPLFVGFRAGQNYVQAVVKNSLGNGSADWTAFANDGNEDNGWISQGITGSSFNDANFTITLPGDGYLFSSGTSGSGGNLVLGTGATGTKNDIVFATGGFLTNNEFARIDHANVQLHLTKTGSKIKFQDGTVQNTAWTGSVAAANVTGLGNISTVNLDGNSSNVLYGNGTFASVDAGTYGDSNLANYLPNYQGTLNSANLTFVANSAIDSTANSSGDGLGFSTIAIKPDTSVVANDQYIIVDPTAPNHIHIRAGGAQDQSTAQLFLGGEKVHVRVTDNNGVRVQNQYTVDDYFYYSGEAPTPQFSNGSWYEDTGSYYVEFTTTNAFMIGHFWDFTNGAPNAMIVYDGVGSNTLSYGGWAGSLGGDAYKVQVLEAPPTNPKALQAIEFHIFTVNTNYVELQTNDFTVNVYDDVRITGRDIVTLRNASPSAPVEIVADYDNAAPTWSFNTDATLTFPDASIQNTAWTGSVAAANVTGLGDIATITLDGNVSNVLTGFGSFVALPTIDANTVVWTTAPVANNSTGSAGQIAYDAGGNLYVCVATDTWAKFTGSTSW